MRQTERRLLGAQRAASASMTSASKLSVLSAVLYARVSSKDQEKEGFSIPAQQELLRSYAADRGFVIEREYIDVETAKAAGRTGFGHMVSFFRKHPHCRVLLVEKTDRLYRNLKDWGIIDDLGLVIHFVKEGAVVGPDSRSSEKLVHGIKVLMAKNYCDNLSEEARKGMLEKARQGMWPSFAPLGYVNTMGSGGKRVIVPDPELAVFVRQLYERYATGLYSLKEVAAMGRADGFAFRKSGAPVNTSTVHKILRNRVYSGDFDFGGITYHGTYEPIVSRELWEQVQAVLDTRSARNTRKAKHQFAFSGLITCGHCGCAMVGEMKKGRYIYYRCTGHRGKCPERYVREEVLEERFTDLLAGIVFTDEVLKGVAAAVDTAGAADREQHEAAVRRLQAEHRRLEERLEAMYVDKLDGRIAQDLYDRKAAEWRAQQAQITHQIEKHQQAEQPPMDVWALADKAVELFKKQPAREKRKLLDFVVAGCSWKHGMLTPHYRPPWARMVEEQRAA